ncbi:MAG: Rid family hydrolase [Pseudomonadota bacterium]
MRVFSDAGLRSPALEAAGFIFLSGFSGMRLDGSLPGSVAGQIEAAFDQVFMVLNASGLTAASIVEVTSYHIGLSDQMIAMKAEWARRFSAPYPAWTAVEVVGLAAPGAVVELRVIAKST